MASSQFSLSWEEYQKNICYGLSLLQQRGEFVDMTIAADGHHVKVHQMVLSLVSPYIKELITSASSSHPVIFLNRVSQQSLQSILEYAYTGEVLVPQERLAEFLEACKALHIKGLENMLKNAETTEAVSTTHIKRRFEESSPITIKRRRRDEPDEDNHSFEEENQESDKFDDTAESFEDYDILEQDNETDNSDVETISSSPMQYTMSCQGSLQMVLDQYIYYIRYTRKNSQTMWRCADYQNKCPAYVLSKGDIVIQKACEHTHPSHEKQILKRVRNGNLFSALKDAERSFTKIKQKRPHTARTSTEKRIKTADIERIDLPKLT